jgi:hypothetical protein
VHLSVHYIRVFVTCICAAFNYNNSLKFYDFFEMSHSISPKFKADGNNEQAIKFETVNQVVVCARVALNYT